MHNQEYAETWPKNYKPHTHKVMHVSSAMSSQQQSIYLQIHGEHVRFCIPSKSWTFGPCQCYHFCHSNPSKGSVLQAATQALCAAGCLPGSGWSCSFSGAPAPSRTPCCSWLLWDLNYCTIHLSMSSDKSVWDSMWQHEYNIIWNSEGCSSLHLMSIPVSWKGCSAFNFRLVSLQVIVKLENTKL